MLDTDYIDLVHNTEVLETAAGWIVDVEFFEEDTFSFVKTYDNWFIPSDDSFCWEDTSDFIVTIQGDNHLKKEAQSVVLPISMTRHCRERRDGRFIKYHNFFLDAKNNFAPAGCR